MQKSILAVRKREREKARALGGGVNWCVSVPGRGHLPVDLQCTCITDSATMVTEHTVITAFRGPASHHLSCYLSLTIQALRHH